MKRLARVVTAVLLTLSGPAAAGAVAYEWLNQEWWTSADTGSVTAPARPETTRPVPAPSPQTAPTPPRTTRHPWPAGSCVTADVLRTECTAGALRVVASLHTHRGEPCHDVPETDHVQRAGAYTLCLATL